MIIGHESPKPELSWLVQAPLFIETPGQEIVKINRWSLGGFEWPELAGACPKTGILTVPFQGIDIRFPVRLEFDKDTSNVTFQKLSSRQRETLALFYRALLSGRMASSADIITSLDTPLDLVPLQETDADMAVAIKQPPPRILRIALNVVTYLIMAVLIVGVLGNNIFNHLDRIDIRHGRVLAPTSMMIAPRDGYVKAIVTAKGFSVQAGDVLLKMHNPVLASNLQKAEVDLELAKVDLANLNTAIDELMQFRGETHPLTRLSHARQIHLQFFGGKGFENLRNQWVALRGQDPVLAQKFDPLEVTIGLLLAQAKRHARVVETRKIERNSRIELLQSAHVIAQSTGIVREILVQPGQYLRPNDPVILFETDTPRVAIGWVSERFSETIYIGMPAYIGLNQAGNRKGLNGTVVDVMAGDDPERPGEFGIIVTVAAQGFETDELRLVLREGAPVNLSAERQIYQRLRGWVLAMISSKGGGKDG